MKNLFLALLTAAVLSACSSSTKLTEPTVEDRTGTPTSANSAQDGSGTGNAVSSRDVAPVDLSKTDPDRLGPKGERTVYFDFDSFIVKPEYQGLLETQARYMKADSNHKAVIEGHTDERGGSEYNLALGQKRAEAVRRALTLIGVPDAQMEAVSFGKEKPADPGHDEAAMAKNRRAVVAYRP